MEAATVQASTAEPVVLALSGMQRTDLAEVAEVEAAALLVRQGLVQPAAPTAEVAEVEAREQGARRPEAVAKASSSSRTSRVRTWVQPTPQMLSVHLPTLRGLLQPSAPSGRSINNLSRTAHSRERIL